MLGRELLDFIVINGFGVFVDSVGNNVVELSAEVHLVTVGQVAAVVEAHGEDGVAGLDEGEVCGHVRLGAGVRLDVCCFCTEEFAGAFDGDLFDFIDEFAAVVVALRRISFGILVGEDGALGGADGAAGVVLGCDQLNAFELADGFLVDPLGDFGIGAAESGDIVVGIFFELVEAACMASFGGESGSEPGGDDLIDFCAGNVVRGNHEDVGIVVVAAGFCELGAVGDSGADAVEAVCDDRHSDAGAAEQNAFFDLSDGNRACESGAEGVVVVFGIQCRGTVIDNLKAFCGECGCEFLFELKAAVVGGNGDAFVVFVPVRYRFHS